MQRGEAVKTVLRTWPAQKRQRTDHHLRNSNLKDIVLDQLLPQHDDAELYAQLHETASWSTLQEREERQEQSDPAGSREMNKTVMR